MTKNNKDKNLFIFLALITIFAIYKYIMQEPINIQTNRSTHQSKQTKPAQSNIDKKQHRPNFQAVTPKELREIKIIKAKEVENLAGRISKGAKEGFLKTAFLEINLPQDMIFKYVEVTELDDTHIIYGQTKDGSREFSALASEMEFNEESIKQSLSEPASFIPNIGPKGLSNLKITEIIPSVAGSGIGKFTIYTGINSNGKLTYAAYTKRIDKKGSYIFILTAPEEYFDRNEQLFDNMRLSVRALAAP